MLPGLTIGENTRGPGGPSKWLTASPGSPFAGLFFTRGVTRLCYMSELFSNKKFCRCPDNRENYPLDTRLFRRRLADSYLPSEGPGNRDLVSPQNLGSVFFLRHALLLIKFIKCQVYGLEWVLPVRLCHTYGERHTVYRYSLRYVTNRVQQ
jgi:hypothetical protein